MRNSLGRIADSEKVFERSMKRDTAACSSLTEQKSFNLPTVDRIQAPLPPSSSLAYVHHSSRERNEKNFPPASAYMANRKAKMGSSEAQNSSTLSYQSCSCVTHSPTLSARAHWAGHCASFGFFFAFTVEKPLRCFFTVVRLLLPLFSHIFFHSTIPNETKSACRTSKDSPRPLLPSIGLALCVTRHSRAFSFALLFLGYYCGRYLSRLLPLLSLRRWWFLAK